MAPKVRLDCPPDPIWLAPCGKTLIEALAVRPDDKLLFAAGFRSVDRYEVATGKRLRAFELRDPGRKCWAIDFSRDQTGGSRQVDHRP